MDELYLILLGALVSFLVQVFKKVFRNTNPLLIVAIFSVFVGGIYAIANQYGLITQQMLDTVKYMFASAIVIFNVLKSFTPKQSKQNEVPAPPIDPMA